MWRRCDRCTLRYIRMQADGEDTLVWLEGLLVWFDLFCSKNSGSVLPIEVLTAPPFVSVA